MLANRMRLHDMQQEVAIFKVGSIVWNAYVSILAAVLVAAWVGYRENYGTGSSYSFGRLDRGDGHLVKVVTNLSLNLIHDSYHEDLKLFHLFDTEHGTQINLGALEGEDLA